MTDKPNLSIAELDRAIAEERLVLLYQPQVTPADGAIASVEALIRLRGGDGALISPDRFVPIAEMSGQIVALGKWALRQACRDAAGWERIAVGVNASPMQFHDPDFVSFVETTLRDTGLSPERLELEITEGAYFDDIDAAEVEVARLRDMGVGVALDDFGTGYASLTYLRRLKISKIKIDKSFVSDFHSVDSAAIIQGVCAMARAMGLKITAEGVETAEQARFLSSAGAHYMQGYLYSPPLTRDDLAKLLRERAAPPPGAP